MKAKDRIYVKVNSDFDSTGYMQPRTITWEDGRIFKIDSVKDYHPNGSGTHCDCFTIIIGGRERFLFFERMDQRFASRVGRWFIEKPAT